MMEKRIHIESVNQHEQAQDQQATGLRIYPQGANFAIQFDAILDYAIVSAAKDVESYIRDIYMSNTVGDGERGEIIPEEVSRIIRESFWSAIGAFLSMAS